MLYGSMSILIIMELSNQNRSNEARGSDSTTNQDEANVVGFSNRSRRGKRDRIQQQIGTRLQGGMIGFMKRWILFQIKQMKPDKTGWIRFNKQIRARKRDRSDSTDRDKLPDPRT
jgi:hypothetical protein